MALLDNLADDRQVFGEKYAYSLERIEALHETLLDFLNRRLGVQEASGKLIYFLAAACLREFNEILVLCAARYGIGALKILRPLYERVITLKYLHHHPELAERFIGYSDIHWNKLLLEARIAAGEHNVMPEERMKEIEGRYKNATATYEQTVCKECGRKGVISWVKLTTPEMAAEVGGEIRKLYFNAFLWPTFNIHTTFYGMSRQLKSDANGKIGFDVTAEDDAVHMAMNIAHGLMIQVLDVLNQHFTFGETELVNQRAREWGESWLEHTPTLEDN